MIQGFLVTGSGTKKNHQKRKVFRCFVLLIEIDVINWHPEGLQKVKNIKFAKQNPTVFSKTIENSILLTTFCGPPSRGNLLHIPTISARSQFLF